MKKRRPRPVDLLGFVCSKEQVNLINRIFKPTEHAPEERKLFIHALLLTHNEAKMDEL